MGSARSDDSSRVWAGHGLTITVTTDPDLRSRIRVAGDLTRASADVLRDCLVTQLRDGGRHAGLDLSAVIAADAAGLAVLLDAHRAYRRCRGTLIVLRVSPAVRRLITDGHADRELLIDARADLPPLVEKPVYGAEAG